jgi:hypothetical protein
MRFAGKITPAAEQDTIFGCGRRIRRTRPLRRRKFTSLWLRLDWTRPAGVAGLIRMVVGWLVRFDPTGIGAGT